MSPIPPIDTSALAAIFTLVWDQYGKTIVDKAGKAVWERLRWEDRALAYAKKMQRLHGTMQILGQAKPVPLEGIYTAVSLLDRPTALGRYTIEEMQAEFAGQGSRYFHAADKERRRDGLEMVRSGENLFILGKPGAGKTTFLKHVALRGVSGELERIPVFVGLKQLSDSGLSVFDFVVGELDVCDFPDATAYLDRLLKSGRAILLFDGLDEVSVADDERARLITDVENFTRKYDRCQRLITCRLAANEFGFQNYTYVEMADFNEGQIREFVAKWFSGDTNQRERRNLFLAELEKDESEGLRELARVPLLLALLCLGFEETLKLSSRRAELYEEALDALLKKWDSERNIRRDEIYRELSLKRKEQMLAQVAAETFDRAEYFIPKKTLARSFEEFLSRVPNPTVEVDGEAVLQAIVAQHGLFMERAHSIYSFAHLTFQEYFTARYVVENEARGTLPRLIEHYADPRYREVFLLTAAQLPDASEFFVLFIERLAADAQRRPAVVTLLRQVAHKTASATGETLRPTAARSAYLLLGRACARARDLARDLARARDLSRDLALARDLNLAFTRDLDLDLALARSRARDLAFASDLARTCNLALALARNLALARARTHVRDRALTRDLALIYAYLALEVFAERPDRAATKWTSVAREFLSTAAIHSASLGDIAMRESLVVLQKEIVSSSRMLDRRHLEDVIEALQGILEPLDLIFPELDDDDWNSLNQYIDGNKLLLACLDQAVVPNREAIKDRLLLLPDA